MSNYWKNKAGNLAPGCVVMIKVLFFAGLREAANTDVVEINAQGIHDVRSLVAQLSKQLPTQLSDALADETAMVSVDHKYAGWEARLYDGAEVGFLPPVSGG